MSFPLARAGVGPPDPTPHTPDRAPRPRTPAPSLPPTHDLSVAISAQVIPVLSGRLFATAGDADFVSLAALSLQCRGAAHPRAAHP